MTVIAAVGQMFYSLSIGMGILFTYGSYMKKEVDMEKAISQVEIMDTLIAFLAGLMIIPAVFAFSGKESLNAGASLMFITMPKVFDSLQLGGFIGLVFFLLVLFAMLHAILLGTIDQVSKVFVAISLGLLIYVGIGSVYSAPVFHAKNYQKQLLLDKKVDFYKDNETISYQSIPVVDRESAIKLGDRKMGQMIDYVSQFEVDESYEQINYQETPYRVTPLEYSDLIKWVTNRKEGLPAYIKVNMVTQESEVVELKEGMKYSKSEHFGRNIYRHLRMNYPTKMFEELAFEIDEKGTLYWIAPVFEYQIGPFGGKDIVGAVLVDAVTGKHKYYDINDIPSWVDRVYPANLVISQLENYGKYTNGYINSIFSQKGVLQPTDGYNYIVIKDDVYLYTGLTSVSKDASNVGFALINLRTKEGKYYHIVYRLLHGGNVFGRRKSTKLKI